MSPCQTRRASLYFFAQLQFAILIVSACLQNICAQPVLSFVQNGATNVTLTWPAGDPDLGLEYTTNLSSATWTRVRADVTNGLCTVGQTNAVSQKFYRLVKPWGTNLPPVMPWVIGLPSHLQPPTSGFFHANGDKILDGPTSYEPWMFSTTVYSILSQVFDAYDIVDPASSTNGSLSYNWIISATDFGGLDFYPARITGYNTAALRFQPDALPNGAYLLRLQVTSKVSNLTTEFILDAPAVDSALDPGIAVQCLPQGLTNGVCAPCARLPE
jgi:hypothetical protein